jgi:hypothetical protein
MLRAIDKWGPGYLRSVMGRPRAAPKHLLLCVADHFEPFRGGIGRADARSMVSAWCREYSASLRGISGSDGRFPRHTFFYPVEEYDKDCMDAVTRFCSAGLGEVEIHLHHNDDTASRLASALTGFRGVLHDSHGLLGRDTAGLVRYGFIHGNWALCNSRPDGDWCGVNEELSVLAGTGCYADFTFPSAPSPTQPRTVNSIYRAVDTPGRSRGHDRGARVAVGGNSGLRFPAFAKAAAGAQVSDPPSSLMLIQGPLALDWGRRKWGLLPRIENSEISMVNPPTPGRASLWFKQHIHVAGRPDWAFVKLHTHGLANGNSGLFTSGRMAGDFRFLADWCDRSAGCKLHFVSAREMFNVVRAAEDGMAGNPDDFRDYEISRPPAVH